MSFITRSLGDICDEVNGTIRTGPFGSQLHESDYVDEGIPVVMPKNIIEGKISTADIAKIREKDADRLSQHQLRAGDIVYGRRGDIGRRALITEREDGWLCGTGCLRVSFSESVLDSAFLYYYLGQQDVIAWIYNQAVGATMPNLNTTILRSIPVSYPSLSTQRKIASVLSAYDDLIENNARRIEILEEMAQNIYREWFVHFRFPGYEKVGMVESELGPIPEGWEVKSLGEICDYINRGIAPKYDDESESIVVNQKCVRNGRLNLSLARRHSKKVPPEKLIRFGDGLINSTGVGTLGRVTQVYDEVERVTVDSHVSIVRANDQLAVDYFGLTLLEFQSHFEHMGQGATGQTELNRHSIANTLILVPNSDIQESFSEIVAPMRRNAVLLGMKNNNLRHTRDLLLPKLISGEVDVEDVDLDAKELIV